MRLAQVNGIASVAVSPDGTLLAVATSLGSVRMLELPPLHRLPEAPSPFEPTPGLEGVTLTARPNSGSAVVQRQDR